jgi:CRP-like cAMP-binding protein
MNTSKSHPVENRILLGLPDQDRKRLLTGLEPFSLSLGTVLYELDRPIDYVYFIESGMVSLVSITEDGETFEVGIVGSEGIVGAAVFLEVMRSQHRTIVQSEGTALRMQAATFRAECDRVAPLQSLTRRYCGALISQVTQSAICSRFHGPEPRLCRWLLQSRDCVRSDDIYLTQDFLAQMLGVYRPAVTLAARTLQKAGLIQYSRGHIRIIDEQGLEDSACECYKAITEANKAIFSK